MSRFTFLQKSWALLALACLAVIAAVGGLQLASEHQALQAQGQRDLAAAHMGYDSLEAEDLRLMGALLDRLTQDNGLRAAFLARDRARLLALAQPQFKAMQDRYDITHFYFLDPPPSSDCFLRVHQPADFGDRIGRRTYRQAVESGMGGEGKELGTTAFALRSVRPWPSADGKRVIGYMELGEEIGHFLSDLKGRTGNDYALLLDKRCLDPVLWLKACHAQGRVSDWSERPVFVLANDTGVVAKQLQWDGVLDALPSEGKVLGLERVKGRAYLTAVFPVDDASARVCGAVLVARDVTVLLQQGRVGFVVAEAMALLALVLLGFLAGWLLGLGDVDPLASTGHGALRRAFATLPEALARIWKR